MDTIFPMRLSRRNAVAAGAVAIAGVGVAGMAGATAAPAAKQGAISSGGGVAGGGLIEGPDASVHIVFSGSRFTLADDSVAMFGLVQLQDPLQSLSMTSGEISFYGQTDGAPDDTREIQGLIAVVVDGEELGDYPFVLTITVGGTPGPEGDAVSLTVGGDTQATPTSSEAVDGDFAYVLSGNLTAGDATLLSFDFS